MQVHKLIGPSVHKKSEELKQLTVVSSALGDKIPTNAAKVENVGDTGSSLERPKLTGIFKLAVYERGGIFGIYSDTFLEGQLGLRESSVHQGTVTCDSTTGTLYRMPIKDFEKKVYLRFDMQSEIERLVTEKEAQMQARKQKIGGIYEITPHMIKEEVELETNKIGVDTPKETASPKNQKPINPKENSIDTHQNPSIY